MLDARAVEAKRATSARAPYALHHSRRWGADPLGRGLWRFALWAPEAQAVELDLRGERHAMARDSDGFWRATRVAAADAPYAFVVDGQPTPDPLARAQMGLDLWSPSRLVDPRRHAWTTEWTGRPWEEAVIYELHIGTFTPEGTFEAATRRLPDLAALGVTALEIMPVAHGPGNRGWGYDGALLFAPHPAYGTPEAMKRFTEAAQSLGLMVILDVVMNHFSPEGSDLHRIAAPMFDDSRTTPWGDAIDVSKPPVRAFFTDLVLGWLTEYRLDGIRFDAVHQVLDPTTPHFLIELGRAVRDKPWGRPIHLILEDERNLTDLRDTGLYTAQWNDDFHHALHARLTGEDHAHLARFARDPIGDLVASLAQGQVEVGQPREGLDEPRGAPSGHLPWTAFVNFLQNHDQAGNHPGGKRLLSLAADRKGVEVAYALLLAAPFTPMIWMGEEQGEETPFHYFCDVSAELGEAISKGRYKEFSLIDDGKEGFLDPNDPATFEASKPFRDEGSEQARHWRELTRRLLALRHERIVPLMKSGRAGPARVERRGDFALSVTWPFRDGFIVAHLNLGGVPDEPPTVTEPHDLALGDIAWDPYAIAIIVSRP
jgi:malto-oligosyltrehalose trehalohydrolase